MRTHIYHGSVEKFSDVPYASEEFYNLPATNIDYVHYHWAPRNTNNVFFSATISKEALEKWEADGHCGIDRNGLKDSKEPSWTTQEVLEHPSLQKGMWSKDCWLVMAPGNAMEYDPQTGTLWGRFHYSSPEE